MAKEAKKTEPIGVRFDKDLLEGVVRGELAKSPQTALNLYEKKFVEMSEKEIEFEKILSDLTTKHQKALLDCQQNLMECGMAITKNNGDEMVSIHPMSEEGIKVQEMAKSAPKEESKVARMIRESREKFLNNKK